MAFPLITRFDPDAGEAAANPKLLMAAVRRRAAAKTNGTGSAGDAGADWALPELRLPDRAEGVERWLPSALTASWRHVSESSRAQLAELASSQAIVVHEGLVADDARTTDNAWVDARIAHVHVPAAHALAAKLTFAEGGANGAAPAPDEDGQDDDEPRWIEVSEDSDEFRRLVPAHRKAVVAALTKSPGLFFAALAGISTDASSLAAVVAHDLDRRIAQWAERVQEESRQVRAERDALDAERAQVARQRDTLDRSLKELAEGTAYLESVLGEILDMKRQLHARLESAPLDLDAEALRTEWRLIEEEKLMIAKATNALEAAMDRLAEAHTAMDVSVAQSESAEAQVPVSASVSEEPRAPGSGSRHQSQLAEEDEVLL